MQQINETYRGYPDTVRVTPSYVSKCTLYLTVTGDLVVLLGNQYLKVTPDEAQSILGHIISQASMFNGNGNTSHVE